MTPDRLPVRLTRRGSGLLVGASVLIGTARLLGVLELMVLGTGAAALVVLALLWVGGWTPRLDTHRDIAPAAPRSGQATTITIGITRAGRGPRNLWIADRCDGSDVAPRQVSLSPSGRTTFGYERDLARGLRHLGPLTATITDPFALATRRAKVGPSEAVVVRPRTENLDGWPATMTGIALGTNGAPAPGAGSDDFAGLRAFQVGDDLRRVHWPSSARRQDLLVRQHESVSPRPRVTVVLDRSSCPVENDAIGGESGTGVDDCAPGDFFEARVSAAASLLQAARRSNFDFRLVVSSGGGSGFGRADAHLDSLLVNLALVVPDSQAMNPTDSGPDRHSSRPFRGGGGPASGPSTLAALVSGLPGPSVVVTSASTIQAPAASGGRNWSPSLIWVVFGASGAHGAAEQILGVAGKIQGSGHIATQPGTFARDWSRASHDRRSASPR